MSKLFIVPTPIGNLKDITIRAIDTLQTVELIYADECPTETTNLVLAPDQMIRLSVFKHRMMMEMRGEMWDTKAKKKRHNKKDRKRRRSLF